MPERSPTSYFVRHVLEHVEESWRDYAILVDKRDNVLTMLMLLHMPVRCIVELQGGDDDNVMEEVSLK